MNPFTSGAAQVRSRLPLPSVFLVVVLTTAAVAQSANGTISGLIQDQSGRAIGGADILIVNDATGVKHPGATNAEGIYAITNLPPGPYRIQVSKLGFKTLIKPDVSLNVQDALAINFTMPVGALAETVTVQGGAPLVNTESGSVSTVIDRNFVENLPLNGRSFNTLLQLTPGVVIAQAQPGSPGQFSISGQRTDANNFSVDGVSANFGVGTSVNPGESGTGGAQAFSVFGGTSSLVSVDALQEFRIETSSFAPEFGRSPGGQVILSTRSGTNSFHGGVFDYFRNTAMDANDWFADQARNPRAPEHHNDFGGFLGGPIRQSKTFFFFSYEGARLALPKTRVIQVPSEFARNTASSALAPYLKAYPNPSNLAVTPGVYTAPLTGTFSDHATLNATSLRIDHTLSDRFSLFGRFNYAPSQIQQHGVGSSVSLSQITTSAVNTETLTIGLNMLLSSAVTNTLRGNYSSQENDTSYALSSFGGALPLSSDLLLGNLPSTGTMGFFQTFDTASYSLGSGGKNRTRQANFTDSLAVTRGLHQLKFGGDYRAIFLEENPAHQSAIFTVSTIQSFLSNGSADLSGGVYNQSDLLIQSLGLYAQDAWKVSPRLTLTYGLRWELSPAPSPREGTTFAAWQNLQDSANITLAPPGTPLWSTTYGNFAPRFGVAYSLTSDGDLVLRAGAGMFYDLGVGQAANLAFTFPNVAYSFAPAVPLPVSNLLPYLPEPSRQPPYSYPQGIDPNLVLPRSYQWNVSLEKSLGGQQALSATYVGQAGRKQLRGEAIYAPNPNFIGDFGLTRNDSSSDYNALQLQYRRPLSSRLQALLNYTWSHSLDNASNDIVLALPSNVISGAKDRASSDFDVRQSFSGALSVNVPGIGTSGAFAELTNNWSLQAVAVVRSGFPFNAVVLFASPDPGGSASSRPDLVPPQTVWISNSNAPGGKTLNPAAFSIPSPPRQGTEGRNDIAGFGLTQVDLSIGRTFSLTERCKIQFRAEAFNVFNHPNFTNPSGYIELGTSAFQSVMMLNQGLQGLNPLFAEGGPRSMQLSLKLTF